MTAYWSVIHSRYPAKRLVFCSLDISNSLKQEQVSCLKERL